MHFHPFRLRVIPRTLRFKHPAGTSRGVYTTRKVWYTVVSSADSSLHFTGLGECAPLPGLSCDYSADYGQRLLAVCEEVERTQELNAERLRECPSMLFGLQTAFRSAEGSLRGDYRLLHPSGFTRGEYGIPINGLVWMGTFEEMLTRMEAKLSQGFRCVKIKIGAIDFESELSLIRKLRERFSPADVELRVDANGSFTVKEAQRRLEQLAQYGIHSIEQPIRQGQWADMAKLCAMTPLPIALDEELIGVNGKKEKAALLDTIRPQYIILKPSLHGAFTGAEEWMDMARKRGIGYWITSALESNVGLNAISQWCAAIDDAPTMPQGLGTGQLFVSNFESAPLRIEGDRLWYGSPKQRLFQKEMADFKAKWSDDSPTLTVHTSGSTGKPRAIEVEKSRMQASAQATVEALGLQSGNTALLAMPLRFIAGQMVMVRSFACHLQLVPVAPSSHPYATLHEAPDFAALTPMQVYESMRVAHERSLLRRTRCLIVGGGAIPPELEKKLRTFPHPVFSTYGMTETLSHIALRRLNGSSACCAYKPLRGVAVSLSEAGTLCIDAPAICTGRLVTNDLAEIFQDGTFRILGRRDNVICSGGIKLQIEVIEEKIATLPFACQITWVADARLGEAVTLLYEAEKDCGEQLATLCRKFLSKYEMPRHFFRVKALPITGTGKPAREEARKMAEILMSENKSHDRQ